MVNVVDQEEKLRVLAAVEAKKRVMRVIEVLQRQVSTIQGLRQHELFSQTSAMPNRRYAELSKVHQSSRGL